MYAVVKGTFGIGPSSRPSAYSPADGFDSTPTTATGIPFTQEIIAVNPVTREIRRLAHHRSRNAGDADYQEQPRASGSVTGDWVISTAT